MESDAGLVQVTNFRGGLAVDNDLDHAERHSDEAVDLKLIFKEFIEHFRVRNDHLYMAMLRGNLAAGIYFVEVEMSHLQQFSGALFDALHTYPTKALPLFEHAVWELAQEQRLLPPLGRQNSIQVQIYWSIPPTSLRLLAQASVARLVCVSGIVVKVSACHARCVRAAIQCTSCSSKTFINGGRSIDLPPNCLENGGRGPGAGPAGPGGGGQRRCRPNPYTLLPMECEYEDQQIIKIQELPEDVPTGELPRHVTVVVDRYLVDRVSPGSRVQIAGIVSVQEKRGGIENGSKGGSKGSRSAAGLRAQYLRCVGLMYITARDGGAAVQSVNQNFSSRVRSQSRMAWQVEEESTFQRFAERGDVYDRLAQSIDPAIFGLQDQKKAIVCLLFGGTRKKQGSNYLRGDMNVLFIGDPSTAKSQLLKFTEKVAPIGIYTSGKGSSAAGLTASVISRGKGDFVLEAGSMVLADGGVVCIDEFDKMRDQDQVAIHEAMEQQTISIAKANLTTMLNSRTSVLAAANPTLGSYDPLRSNEDQMDFQSSILSRFDLIFKMIDPRNPETDNRLAQHVVNLHKGGSSRLVHTTTSAVVERSFFTRYVSYARATRQPKISEEAMSVLLDFYVHVRRDAHQQTLDALSNSSGTKSQTPIIQITARQLESLVRITESLARMRLDVLASRADAEEAIRLFKSATVDAIKSGVSDQSLTAAQSELVLRIEEALRRRVALGATVEHNRLMSEMARMGFDIKLVERAVYAMVKREELEWRKQRALIHRLRNSRSFHRLSQLLVKGMGKELEETLPSKRSPAPVEITAGRKTERSQTQPKHLSSEEANVLPDSILISRKRRQHLQSLWSNARVGSDAPARHGCEKLGESRVSGCVEVTEPDSIVVPNFKVGSLEMYKRFPLQYDYLMRYHDCSLVKEYIHSLLDDLQRSSSCVSRNSTEGKNNSEVDAPGSLSSFAVADFGCGTGRMGCMMSCHGAVRALYCYDSEVAMLYPCMDNIVRSVASLRKDMKGVCFVPSADCFGRVETEDHVWIGDACSEDCSDYQGSDASMFQLCVRPISFSHVQQGLLKEHKRCRLIVCAWSLSYVMRASWGADRWHAAVDATISNLLELLDTASPSVKSSNSGSVGTSSHRGTSALVIIETLGTNTTEPRRQNTLLERLETHHGFERRWVRSDYNFPSMTEAVKLTRFFFGESMSQRVQQSGDTKLAECTGIWTRWFD